MNTLNNNSSCQKPILKVLDENIKEITDTLAVEEPLEISISILKANPPVFNKNISITMRTPNNDTDLALGFLFTEGILFSNKQVDSVFEDENKVNVFLNTSHPIDLSKIERHFYTSSSCGVCGKSSIDSIKTVCKLKIEKDNLKIEQQLIKTFPEKLRQQQSIFDATGGLHAAVLFDADGNITALREDVGRHNALDKLIGAAFQNDLLPLRNQLLLLSGRASFELIQKASMAGIKFVMAVGAPSSLAVELAEEFGMTLIGFLSEKRFNIYTDAHRVAGFHEK